MDRVVSTLTISRTNENGSSLLGCLINNWVYVYGLCLHAWANYYQGCVEKAQFRSIFLAHAKILTDFDR